MHDGTAYPWPTMAGYAILASVTGVSPHALAHDETRRPAAWPPAPSETTVVELAGVPFAHSLTERLERWRELWSQTTFFLFDAEGWR